MGCCEDLLNGVDDFNVCWKPLYFVQFLCRKPTGGYMFQELGRSLRDVAPVAVHREVEGGVGVFRGVE